MKQYIDRSGYKQTFLADKLGLSRQSFNKKVNGRVQFSAGEAVLLGSLLGVDTVEDFNDLFLTEKIVNNNPS